MALTNCKECDKQISNSADKCPHCGKKQNKGGFWKLIIGIVIILTLMTSIAKCMDEKSIEKAQKSDQEYLSSLTPEKREAELQARQKLKALEEKKKKEDEKRSFLAYQAFKAVKGALNDPDSLKVEWIGINDAATVACVDYRSKNSLGGYMRMTTTFINGKPSQSAQVWNGNCAGKSLYNYTYVKGM